MPLTPEISRIVMQQLGAQIRACTMCGNTAWEATEVIAPFGFIPPLPSLTDQTPMLGPGVVPLVVVVCTNCFHVVLYSWIQIEKAHRAGLGRPLPQAPGGP